MYIKTLRLGSILLASILIALWCRNVESSYQAQTSPLAYQPIEYATVKMYQLNASGAINGPLCSQANQFSWGCTAYCTNLSICNGSQTLSFPMNTNPANVEIDGTAGAPGVSQYKQYLRDVVPLELGIQSGSQGNKPLSATKAQAIAARTYIYQRMEYIGQYGTPNNSNLFHVFVPYNFDTLTSTQKGRVQEATADRIYMTEPDSTYPIEALYGADNPANTSPGNRPYLKSVSDPISFLGTLDGTANGGMSAKGASRWSFGHTSSRGPVASGDPNYPHDAQGDGDFWSVRLDEAAQILTHYYTGVHLRDANTMGFLTLDYRWVPLQIAWSGNCPPAMNHGQSCTATIQVQNTSTLDWNCGSVGYILSYRWAKTGYSETDGANQVSLCGTIKGATPTVNLIINNIPNWGAGAYTLKIDIACTLSGNKYWFSNVYGWPSYDISVCVDSSCRIRLPQIAK